MIETDPRTRGAPLTHRAVFGPLARADFAAQVFTAAVDVSDKAGMEKALDAARRELDIVGYPELSVEDGYTVSLNVPV